MSLHDLQRRYEELATAARAVLGQFSYHGNLTAQDELRRVMDEHDAHPIDLDPTARGEGALVLAGELAHELDAARAELPPPLAGWRVQGLPFHAPDRGQCDLGGPDTIVPGDEIVQVRRIDGSQENQFVHVLCLRLREALA